MAKFRRMVMEGPARAKFAWEEFDSEEASRRYARTRGGWPAVLDVMLNDPASYVEVERNGDWRPASYHEIPKSHRSRQIELGQLIGQADSVRSRAANKVEVAAEKLTTAKASVDEAMKLLGGAQAGAEEAGEGVRVAEKEAAKIDRLRAKRQGQLEAIYLRDDGVKLNGAKPDDAAPN